MVPADADLRIKLPVFEGPLDLLLFLIRKNELDIYDIPISTVTKQYIAVLRSMQQLDLEIAGEFFVMAASLMEIKSRMLLPRGQAATGEGDDDDPLDPRWELVHQLLQYKKFKEAAAKLDELASFQRDMLTRHVVEVVATENERPLKPVDRIELWNAFNLVLRRLSEKLVVGEIKGEEVTVSDKMEELLKLIETRKHFLFTDLFEGKQVTVRLLVATFIAVLELTRLKKLRVRQEEAYADIYVEAVENTLNADGTLAEGQLNFSPVAPEQNTAVPAPLAPAVDLVLTADGFAEIPSVIGASADAPASPPPVDTETSAHQASPSSTPPSTPGDTAPQPDAAASAFSPETAASIEAPSATNALNASDPVEPSASPNSLAASPADEPAAVSPPSDGSPSAEPTLAPSPVSVSESFTPQAVAPLEDSPSSPPDDIPPEPEQFPPENPLDTEPPRNTLTS